MNQCGYGWEIFANAMRLYVYVWWRRFDAFKGLSANSSAATHNTHPLQHTRRKGRELLLSTQIWAAACYWITMQKLHSHMYGSATELKRVSANNDAHPPTHKTTFPHPPPTYRHPPSCHCGKCASSKTTNDAKRNSFRTLRQILANFELGALKRIVYSLFSLLSLWFFLDTWCCSTYHVWRKIARPLNRLYRCKMLAFLSESAHGPVSTKKNYM